MAETPPLIRVTREGLTCARGGFTIDPWEPVDRAVLTHGHGDHARPGSARYHAAAPGLGILEKRLAGAAITAHAYGARVPMGDTIVSFHPAGHVLGSAQIRIEAGDEVWVVSGDYKRAADPTCAPFEVVRCDTFVTEATFALPIYRWEPTERIVRDVIAWWDSCIRAKKAAVLLAYALGKAQRLLAELHRLVPDREVWVHGAIEPLVAIYRAAGVTMLPTKQVAETTRGTSFAGQLVLAPHGAIGTPWMKRFGDCETAFASGKMQIRGTRRRGGFDRGFVLSDHADWPALLDTIAASGARRVLATHGQSEPLVRWLRERGASAATLATSWGETEE